MRWIFAFLLPTILLLPWAARAQEETVEATVSLPAPISLDPVSLSRFDTSGRDIVENLFVGLTRLNARTGQIEPWLAESWSVSPDGLTWTFNLRSDIQWVHKDPATGQFNAVRPVVAGDVVFALQRACDRQRPSPVASNIFVISGCRPLATYDSLISPPMETLAVRAVDEKTLEIQLLFPAGYFLTMTSLPEFRPLPSEYVDDALGNWLRPDFLITSGPWVVQEWLIGGMMRLERNTFWPDAPVGNLTAVTVRFDMAADALPSEIQAGLVDAARVDPLFAAGLQASAPDALKARQEGELVLLGFSLNNVTTEGVPFPTPLDVPEVRRALALALDRDALAVVMAGTQSTDHFTPVSVIGAPSSPGAAFDPTAAQTALAMAGYPGCAGLGQVTLAATQNDLALAQAIVGQWTANLGCSIETFPIFTATRAAILDSAHSTVDVLESSRFPLWIIRWNADYPDAQAWITDALHCDYGYFRVGRPCGQVDTVMDQAGFSADVMSRFTAYNQIETELFGAQGSFPVIPLLREQSWFAQQPSLQGIGAYGPLQFDRWTKNTGS